MALDSYYEQTLQQIKRILASEDPPDHWGYYVYCTYSRTAAEQYGANITIPVKYASSSIFAPH